jgi:hypothetical protein
MAEEEEEPLGASGISEEEIVVLATRSAKAGPLSDEELAIIVSDKSTAEELRELLSNRGGAII